jgi:signal transduction histidine kinase
MEELNFKNVSLFPKKTSLIGVILSGCVIALSITVGFLMWNSLQEIEETHFPAIERSAINVRLVNLIDYQFNLALQTVNKRVIDDLSLNFDSLEQNFDAFNTQKEMIKDKEMFLFGKEIIDLLKKKRTKDAKNLLDKSNFFNKLENFSNQIFDHTEEMAEKRDENSLRIKSLIDKLIYLSIFISLFIIYLITKVYSGYNANLTQRLYAEEKAKKLSKQRTSLIQVLCHDLGNPISAIHGLIQIAHILPEVEKKNMISTISENTQVALDIIELTKKMQAIESGKLEMELVPISMKSAIEKSIFILKDRVLSKKITFEFRYNEDAKILADETSLVNSILNNILTNCVKFSDHDSKIYISSSETDSEFTLSIKDSGLGMPKELLENLFSETAETSRPGTDGEQGTGFGMPLVKKFIEAYEGRIEVISSTDGETKGTTSILTFKKA